MTPPYNGGLLLGRCTISTANTARDGTGTLAICVDAVDYWRAVTSLAGCAQVTSSAGMLRWFIDFGEQKLLRWEMLIDAITVAANTKAWWHSDLFGAASLYGEILLPPSAKLLVGTHIGEAMNAFAHGVKIPTP